MRDILVIAHNLRSTHNVGSILRTAEGLGARVICSGYTPYPALAHDSRLPHIRDKLTRQIAKTALGAELLPIWTYQPEITKTIAELRVRGYLIVALEQTAQSIPLFSFDAPSKVAIVIGREVEGVEPEVLALCDTHLSIPMSGQKESFNVAQATAMALYQLRFIS